MTFAEKLLAIAQAKVGIRAAIIAKGVDVDVSVPFSEYPNRIMLIEGGGESPDVPKTEVTSGFSVRETSVSISFIPVHEVTFAESFGIYGVTSESGGDSVLIVFPPTDEKITLETADISSILGFAPFETVSFEFSLFAFAESFKPHTAYKYDYDADWVKFSDDGAYVADRVFVNRSENAEITENGVYFSAKLPDRREYGNIIKLSSKVEVTK